MKDALLVILAALTLILVLTGCGAEERWTAPRLWVDPSLQGYLDHYVYVAGDKGHMDELELVHWGHITLDPGENAVAHCTKDRYVDDLGVVRHRRQVTIDPERTETYPANVARLVSHELGHCLHDLVHTTEPLALMNPVDDGDASYWHDNLDQAIRNALGK